MTGKSYLLIIGAALTLMGLYLLITYFREKNENYSLIQGRIAEVLYHYDWGPGKRRGGFTYTPIIEYKYNGVTYETEHRISSASPKWTYKAGDIVELRVYEDKPDKAIINSRLNTILPLMAGIGFLVLSAVFYLIAYLI